MMEKRIPISESPRVDHIILTILNNGSMGRKPLCTKVAAKQKELITDYQHTKGTCEYWVESHIRTGNITKIDTKLELTLLGKWIVNSSIGNIDLRDYFIAKYTCPKCRPYLISLYEIDRTTENQNKQENISMKVTCPKCGYYITSEKLVGNKFKSLEEYFHFYDNTKAELKELGIIK